MLVNVKKNKKETMQFEGVIDYRLVSLQDRIICAVICQPVVTRTERNSILTGVAEKLFEVSGKDVFVCADLDVYCDLGREDVDCNTLIRKIAKRNCITKTSDPR